MNKYIGFLLLFGFLMLFDNLQGQDEIRVFEKGEKVDGEMVLPKGAKRAKEELAKGVLIVLLKSEYRRLSQLEILSRSDEYSEKGRKGFLKKIEEIKESARLKNEGLIEGFAYYQFSDVYFAYDTSLSSIQNGLRKGFFVNENQEVDETIILDSEYIYLCRYGSISTSQEKEGLIITNIDNERIPRPFPSVAVSGASSFLLMLNLITNNESYMKRSIARDIMKFEEEIINMKKNDD